MSKALYRKHRSKSLDTIIGQSHITDVLGRALASDGIFHAYLFTGPRGVGKTSIARILAHEINKLPYTDDSDHLDIIEIDAASNNGVDDVRDLREKAMIAPAVADKKVYIIDEVHMLSKPAFNALLKILEEPPEHIVFILATTDADKLPATIISRTQRFHFRYVPEEIIANHLMDIAKKEKISLDKDASLLIARQGGGSVRDSLSLLDQLHHVADKITVENIQKSIGLASSNAIATMLDAYKTHDSKRLIATIDTLTKQGVSPVTLAKQLAITMRDNLASHPEFAGKIESLLDVGRSFHPEIRLLVILLENMPPSTPEKAKSIATQATLPRETLEISATKAKQIKETSASIEAPKDVVVEPKKERDEPTVQKDTQLITEESFDWPGLLAHVHEKDLVVFTMLNQCTPEISDGKLMLYTGRKFHKTKLDDPKQRAKINQFIQEVGMGDILIETIGTPPPPRDATLAKIAELMGGGEEVDAK